MKITNGLAITETKEVFNSNLFRLYDFYKVSKDDKSDIWQLVKNESDRLTFVVCGQMNESGHISYAITTEIYINNKDFKEYNIEVIPYKKVKELIITVG